ncbi:MAG: hypothetical protein V4671_02330 [Armatimonadota bacterium]
MNQSTYDRQVATIDLILHLHWYWSLPRRYKLIYGAIKVRRHMKLYAATVPNGINTPKQARERWLAEALRKACITEDDFHQGDLLDDLRDYRLLCELHDLPLCCPHYVKERQ